PINDDLACLRFGAAPGRLHRTSYLLRAQFDFPVRVPVHGAVKFFEYVYYLRYKIDPLLPLAALQSPNLLPNLRAEPVPCLVHRNGTPTQPLRSDVLPEPQRPIHAWVTLGAGWPRLEQREHHRNRAVEHVQRHGDPLRSGPAPCFPDFGWVASVRHGL